MFGLKLRPGADPRIYRMLLDREQLPLPYREYDDENKIYHMDDGGLSVIFECRPYGGFNAEAGLTTAMSCLPEGAAMQFILFPSGNITRIVDNWKVGKKRNEEIYALTRDNFAGFLESKTSTVISANMRAQLCDYTLVVAVNLGGRAKEYSVFEQVTNLLKGKVNKKKKDEKEDDFQEYQKRFKQLADIQKRVKAALSAANLFPMDMEPNALIRFIFSIFNPRHDFRQIATWQGDGSMPYRMISNNTAVEVAEDHIRFDGVYARSMSVKDYPYEWTCAMAEHLVGHPFGMQTIESGMMLCLNIINEGKTGINDVKRRSQIILSQKMPEHLFPLLAMKQRDLAMANKELEKGKAIFHINYAIMAFADSYDNLNNIAGQIKSYYRQLGFLLEEDLYINLPVMLSMLPGNYDGRMKQDLARGRPVFMENAVDLVPCAADWGGNTAKAELFFITPRGQLFAFDFFASNTNYNSFIIGTSGAGKSVALQYMAMNYMMSGNRIYIIDIGGSYENFCAILGGQYIDIKQENPICLNPWTDIEDKSVYRDFQEFFMDWYWLMGCPADYKLAEEQEMYIKSYLALALDLTYEKYGRESSVDTVIECFKEVASQNQNGRMDSRCCDFIQVLGMYSSTGPYGKFFNGHCEIKLTSDIVVLENGSMENIPALRDPVLMILTFHIEKSIYLAHDLTRKSLVLIDEAHKFLGNPRVDGFIQQAYRRYRKHNAAMIIGTQGWEDLADGGKAGRVIIENSAFQIFMAQSPASTEKLKNSTSHNFNEYEKQMIGSIRSIKGEYSEAVLLFEKTKIKIRIVLDDWMKRIYFTTPAMRTYIRARVAEGMSFKDALDTMPKDLIK